ncbi:hypothetical protein E2N92_12180 [Methanofollis formosanus]|uniref:DUF3821 domain-containing protein n=1 Tax=Methanofollis formosanus TaxID=299308 RepID=A0A8G1EGT3_9EURY|nr:hypothetical protein [Methanofollis formosanus]QYZ80130.1 hypothetical protein E2N92_12180 [Methanofollis formosanus]
MAFERTAYLMLFILGLCLLAGPGTAREIAAGDSVFAYEDSRTLDFSALNQTVFEATGEELTRLTRYVDDDPEKGEMNVFELVKQDGVLTTRVDLASYPYDADDFGTYFAETPTYTTECKVYLREPRLTLDIVLADYHAASVVGKTVTPSTRIAFKILSGKVGSSYRDGDRCAQARIELRTPSGALVHRIGDVNLAGQDLTATTVFVGQDVDLRDLEPGTYTVRAVWDSPESFDDYARGSDEVQFAISDTYLSIETNMDSLVRRHVFTATIYGDAKKTYYLYIKDAGIPAERYPTLKPGQTGVTPLDGTPFAGGADAGADALANDERAQDPDGATVNGTAALVATSTSCSRSFEIATSWFTEARAYTIKVVDPADATLVDEVTVRVDEGEVTVVAGGTGTFAFGEIVWLSGTNTDSDEVSLFMTGPGLHPDGVLLTDPTRPVSAGLFSRCSVGVDGTWKHLWDTSALAGTCDPGTYTVYAVGVAANEHGCVNATNLEGVTYGTTSLAFSPPSVSASVSRTVIRQGDALSIDARTTGNPPGVQVWIFGEHCLVMETVREQSYAGWRYTLSPEETVNLSGDHYVIVQHPMEDGVFDVRPLHPENAFDTRFVDASGTVTDLGALSPGDAARAVADAIASCDDAAARLSFEVEAFRDLAFDRPSTRDRIVDGTLRLGGHSTLPTGTLLTWTVTPYNTTTVLASGTAAVRAVPPDGFVWDFEVDLSALEEGNYTTTVYAPDRTLHDTLTFTLYGGPARVYPAAGHYGVGYAFVHPALAEPPGSREFVTLMTLVPKDRDGSAFPAEHDLQIESSGGGWPTVRYSILVDGHAATARDGGRTVTINGWDLAYPAQKDVQVDLGARCYLQDPSPSLPAGGVATFLTIVELDQDGTPVPGSAFMLNRTLGPAGVPPGSLDVIALAPGWNFVSVPTALAAGNDTAAVFAAVDTASHSVFRYDTANGAWVALKAADRIAPLEGFWIFANRSTTVPLTFSTALPVQPAARDLSPGWNAVGVAAAPPERAVAAAGGGGGGGGSYVVGPASARDALLSVNGKWTTLIGFDAGRQTFETAIVSGGSGAYADSRLVYPQQGYWLYMTEPGTLCGLAV